MFFSDFVCILFSLFLGVEIILITFFFYMNRVAYMLGHGMISPPTRCHAICASTFFHHLTHSARYSLLKVVSFTPTLSDMPPISRSEVADNPVTSNATARQGKLLRDVKIFACRCLCNDK